MLTGGSRIGPYEIIAPLGAGGMGEVYRARDTRIGREVALKVLPPEVANDRDRLERFQREAESAGALNHPNLMTIYELGVDGDRPFIVSELLEGTTLRDRLSSGPIPQRKAADYALQIAEGLAAAHDKGIVHRDLKPENIFITRDGRVKILDFGLAKLRSAGGDVRADEKTVRQQTDPGAVLGTAGYMSPEQVRGEAADSRSDIFAFGVNLYEMLTGRRAFRGPSSIDTMHAILNSDPEDVSTANPQISPALQRIVHHCLEKSPEERFQSARDLAFDLESLSDTTSASQAIGAWKKRKPLLVPISVAAAVALAAIALAYFLGKRDGRVAPARFQRLTYHSTFITSARFGPDGRSIVYGADTGNGRELFVARLESPEVRPLGIRDARILSISRSGEMAILLNARLAGSFSWTGTLARAPFAGGAPREVAASVEEADWNPSADDLAIIRNSGGSPQLEYPIGKVLHQTGGWMSHMRFSPTGREIAYLDHPRPGTDGGSVALLELDGTRRILSTNYASVQGLAWSGDGTEIWFTGSKSGNARELMAVDRKGRERRLAAAPNALTICDVLKNGTALLIESNPRLRLFALPAGESVPRELSWLDWSLARDISADLQQVLFDETGDGGGPRHSVYMRPMAGGPAVRLGDGIGSAFSRDGRAALAIQIRSDPPQLVVYPTGAGETRVLKTDIEVASATWMPDGERIVVVGHERNRLNRVFLMSAAGGKPEPISEEGIEGNSMPSPDGHFIVARSKARAATIFPVPRGTPRVIPEIDMRYRICGWSPDSKGVLYFTPLDRPARIMRYDLGTNQSAVWKEIAPPGSDAGIASVRISRDGSSYLFSTYSDNGDLYLLTPGLDSK